MRRRDQLAGLGLEFLCRQAGRAHPAAGTLRLAGLAGTVEVRRDFLGVPWIRAAGEQDLYFAAGYVQAGDRLWQMDVLRRRPRGQLSEIFGAATLSDDLRARQLALVDVADRSLALLTEPGRACLQAFSDGVNAAIGRMRRRLPVEFQILRYRPKPWTPLDSILIVKNLGFDLGTNLKYELFRSRLYQEHPEHAESFRHPCYPADGAVTIHDVTGRGDARPTDPASSTAEFPPDLPAASQAWLQQLRAGHQLPGSNAWAISPARSVSGYPLLANDPHIQFLQPSLWYQIGLELLGNCVGYGVTVPGLPGIIAGSNAELAWGITNATIDTQDLCVLTGETDRSWSRREEIDVRGQRPVPVQVAGGHGYVELTSDQGTDGGRYGLFWSGLTPSAEIEACQRLWQAGSYPEFRRCLGGFGVPVLNVVVACRDGTIALKTAGRVPRRLPGSGLLPAPLAEVRRSWQGFLDFEELPETVNPDEGFIVSANHKLLPDGAGVELGQDWAAPYRAERIAELVRHQRATAELCRRWQNDVVNGRARRILPTLLAALEQAPPAGVLAAACHRLLRDWDGHDSADQAAPLIFLRLTQVLAEHWIADRIGAELAAEMQDIGLQVDRLLLDASARQRLAETEPLSTVVSAALTEAADRIADLLGSAPDRWRYDAAHRIQDRHPLAAAAPALARLFGGHTTPIGGGGYTVCLMSTELSGAVAVGPCWHFVAELAPDGPRLFDVLRHGSSGNPTSVHYDDQTATHAAGHLYQVPLTGPAMPPLRLLPITGRHSRRGRIGLSLKGPVGRSASSP